MLVRTACSRLGKSVFANNPARVTGAIASMSGMGKQQVAAQALMQHIGSPLDQFASVIMPDKCFSTLRLGYFPHFMRGCYHDRA